MAELPDCVRVLYVVAHQREIRLRVATAVFDAGHGLVGVVVRQSVVENDENARIAETDEFVVF